MAARLTQIVPSRSIAPEGVGDYATRIAERMHADHGIETQFIACTPLPAERRLKDRWDTHELTRRGAAELLAALEATGDAPVLLQLSGYGFHPRALTFWVARALECWVRTNPSRRIVTVFHELYATGPIWSSPFWIGGLQKRGVRRVFRASVGGIATTQRNVALLRGWESAGPPVHWMPCFATVGEPTGEVAKASDRPARLAVFGRASVGDMVYRRNLALLEKFVSANRIDEIIDIGPRAEAPPSTVGAAPVKALGETEASRLIGELSAARFGLIHYEADRLAKSSIFGALCACGAIPVCISPQAGISDALQPDRNYLLVDEERPVPAPDNSRLDDLQSAAQAWYKPHSIGEAVSLIHHMIS